MQLQERLYQWTVKDYHRLLETGLLTEKDRVELLEGLIVTMSPKGIPHVITTDWIAQVLRQQLQGQAHVRTQDPITLNDRSEPEPDIVVVRGSLLDYSKHHPFPQDVLLLIEVADTTLATDREEKIPIYSRAKIQECWLVDVNRAEITVYRQPLESQYQSVKVYTERELFNAKAFPEITFHVKDLFLPQSAH
jgi:Uma2 family endonuclease